MRTICPFCKTEYSVSLDKDTTVKCVCCGKVWNVHIVKNFGKLLIKFLMALCALLSAVIFSVAVLTKHKEPELLTIKLLNSTVSTDKIVISGIIKNESEKLMAIPDLIAIVKDNNGNILREVKIIPPVPVLDIDGTAVFTNTIVVSGAKKIKMDFVK